MNRFTLFGILAILFWSTTIAFSRSVSEVMGPLTTGAIVYTLGGLLSLAAASARAGSPGHFFRMPKRYLLVCGAMFVLYILLIYLAIGLARDRTIVLAAGLANYLWPSLIILFSLPILGNRPNLLLIPGLALGLGGTWLAVTGSEPGGLSSLTGHLDSLLPIALAGGAAVLWGVYSNLVRRWGPDQGDAVALFLLASGICFWLLRWLMKETSGWNLNLVPMLLFMVIFPTWLAYQLWDHAMKKGDVILVASISFFSPLLSTLVSLLVLGVRLNFELAGAAVLITAGAIFCKLGVRPPQAQDGQMARHTPK